MGPGVERVRPDETSAPAGTMLSDAATRPEMLDIGRGPIGPRRLARLMQRIPRMVRGLAVAAVIGLVVVYALASTASRRQHAPAPPPVAVAGEQAAAAQAMAMVEASARNVSPRRDYVRSNSTRGACGSNPSDTHRKP